MHVGLPPPHPTPLPPGGLGQERLRAAFLSMMSKGVLESGKGFGMRVWRVGRTEGQGKCMGKGREDGEGSVRLEERDA